MAENTIQVKENPVDLIWSIIHEWWKRIIISPGDRASLKRARNGDMVASQFAYFDLYRRIFNSDIPDFIKKSIDYRLPLVAGLVSHIKEDNPGRAVASVMGSSSKAGSDRATVSDLRFRKLLRTDDNDELYIMMIRMIRMMDENVNVKDLARSIYFWNDQTKRKWASQYYLKKDQ